MQSGDQFYNIEVRPRITICNIKRIFKKVKALSEIQPHSLGCRDSEITAPSQ